MKGNNINPFLGNNHSENEKWCGNICNLFLLQTKECLLRVLLGCCNTETFQQSCPLQNIAGERNKIKGFPYLTFKYIGYSVTVLIPNDLSILRTTKHCLDIWLWNISDYTHCSLSKMKNMLVARPSLDCFSSQSAHKMLGQRNGRGRNSDSVPSSALSPWVLLLTPSMMVDSR